MALTANQTAAIHEAIREFVKKNAGATPEKVFVKMTDRFEGVTLVTVKAYLDSIGHVSRPERADGKCSLVP